MDSVEKEVEIGGENENKDHNDVVYASTKSPKNPWSALWREKQRAEFAEKYPWLTAVDGKLGRKVCKVAQFSIHMHNQVFTRNAKIFH